MWPNRTDNTIHFWCNTCRESGDIVKFTCYVEGIEFLEACKQLGVLLDGEYVTAPRRQYNPNDDDPPKGDRQKKAKDFTLQCKESLMSPDGSRALAWLRARGLTDDMIDHAGLGFNPVNSWPFAKEWSVVPGPGESEKIWIPRGITIPWLIEGHLWNINIRRTQTDIEKDKARGVKEPAKYVNIKGGSEGIYGIDRIIADPSLPVLVVEGEFDKLIAERFAGDICNVVATGSTGKGRGERGALLIAQSPSVLIGFDDDEDGQGEKAAKKYWLQAIPHSILWLPWAHDVTDMYKEELNIREWVEAGVELATAMNEEPPHQDILVQEPEEQTCTSDDVMICVRCGTVDTGKIDFRFSDDSDAFCSAECQDYQPVEVSEPAPVQHAPAPADRELSNEEIVSCLVAAILGRIEIMLTSKAYKLSSRHVEARERSAKMWPLVRDKMARPHTFEWLKDQVKKRDRDAEKAAYEGWTDEDAEDIEPIEYGDRLEKLEAVYRANTPSSVLWRVRFNGWTPGNITAGECIHRLSTLLSNNDEKIRYEASRDIDSRLYQGQRRWA